MTAPFFAWQGRHSGRAAKARGTKWSDGGEDLTRGTRRLRMATRLGAGTVGDGAGLFFLIASPSSGVPSRFRGQSREQGGRPSCSRRLSLLCALLLAHFAAAGCSEEKLRPCSLTESHLARLQPWTSLIERMTRVHSVELVEAGSRRLDRRPEAWTKTQGHFDVGSIGPEWPDEDVNALRTLLLNPNAWRPANPAAELPEKTHTILVIFAGEQILKIRINKNTGTLSVGVEGVAPFASISPLFPSEEVLSVLQKWPMIRGR